MYSIGKEGHTGVKFVLLFFTAWASVMVHPDDIQA